MKNISAHVKTFIIILCCLVVVFFVLEYRNEIAWFFQKNFFKTRTLNLDKDISSIQVRGSILEDKITVDDKECIDKLIDVLNSLKIVKRESKGHPDFSVGSQQYAEICTEGHVIHLSGRYIKVFDSNLPDKTYELYYVKYPKDKFEDKNNEITQVLNSLI